MQAKTPATPVLTRNTVTKNPDLDGAIRRYVRVHQRGHGRRQTAETLGVSRHTLWRYLERGHTGRALPAVVLNSVGRSRTAIEAATLELIIDLEGLRPDPALRPLRRGLEDALLLCAAPLATVDELARFGRVPASTLAGTAGETSQERPGGLPSPHHPGRSGVSSPAPVLPPRSRASPPPGPPPGAAGTC